MNTLVFVDCDKFSERYGAIRRWFALSAASANPLTTHKITQDMKLEKTGNRFVETRLLKRRFDFNHRRKAAGHRRGRTVYHR